MVKGRGIAAAGLYVMTLMSAAANAQTQDQGTVGNPQLKNFELPGTTTVPPPAQPPVATTPPATPPASPPAPDPRAPEAAPPAPAEAARAPQRQVAAPRRREAPPPAAAAAPAAAAPAELQEALPAPVAPPVQAPQALPLPPPPVADTPAPQERGAGFPWHYLIIAAVFGLLAFAGYRKFSRAGLANDEPAAPEPMPMPAPEPMPMPAPEPMPAPQPQPQPAPAASDIVGIQLRPWIEVEFRPARAAATLTDASVQFELIIRNRGNAPARNIRIESGIFNAGPDQEREIAAWYSEPVRERTPPSIPVMAPGEEIQIKSAVTIAKENMREIEVQGRKLFIPTVAFNLVYDWGANKSGQTSVSYVVGREAETPSQKMGPFRLDLGPRLYRSVGQRQTKVAVRV